jgi:hypothetical protein
MVPKLQYLPFGAFSYVLCHFDVALMRARYLSETDDQVLPVRRHRSPGAASISFRGVRSRVARIAGVMENATRGSVKFPAWIRISLGRRERLIAVRWFRGSDVPTPLPAQ